MSNGLCACPASLQTVVADQINGPERCRVLGRCDNLPPIRADFDFLKFTDHLRYQSRLNADKPTARQKGKGDRQSGLAGSLFPRGDSTGRLHQQLNKRVFLKWPEPVNARVTNLRPVVGRQLREPGNQSLVHNLPFRVLALINAAFKIKQLLQLVAAVLDCVTFLLDNVIPTKGHY